jgi:hypothetical protein
MRWLRSTEQQGSEANHRQRPLRLFTHAPMPTPLRYGHARSAYTDRSALSVRKLCDQNQWNRLCEPFPREQSSSAKFD